MQQIKERSVVRTLAFTKENNTWYADLPEFIEQGLGTKANLMMVDGADSFLDLLSENGSKVVVNMSAGRFSPAEIELKKETMGLNMELLHATGHAPVTYGAYYEVAEYRGKLFQHRLWLCPVTEYVFDGGYPSTIYLEVLQAG